MKFKKATEEKETLSDGDVRGPESNRTPPKRQTH
jgi:hypothetical protein